MAYSSKAVEKQAMTALRKLRSFLDASEPRLVYFLVNLWKAQGDAITYKELREAILAGELAAEYLEEWREDYARFVTKYLLPEWEKAIAAAAAELKATHPDWKYNPAADGVSEWMHTRAAEFVTSVSDTQIEGLRAVIYKASQLHDMSVDELARAIRPMVGLYAAQSVANLRYYETLIGNGVSTKRARDLSIRYGARQHRYRAYMIARTEMAFGYNKGMYEGVKQAQRDGYVGEVKKIWCTAEDERVCSSCGALEGKEIALDDEFGYYTKLQYKNPGIKRTPPAHPNCRCTTLYLTSAPDFTQQRNRIIT